jgi:mannosyl-3-phosphoglycerate phosphatase
LDDNHSEPVIILFTDLDGTLLDHDTYAWQPAAPALDFLRSRGIPWILCTSKTRAEVELLRQAMNHTHPFIVENGGGIFIPKDTFPFEVPRARRVGEYDVLTLGADYPSLVQTLNDAAAKTGVRIRSFHQMTPAEIAGLTAVPESVAVFSKQREFDEPFYVCSEQDPHALLRAIEAAGRNWTQGGRFYHIIGDNDKTRSVGILTVLYRRKFGSITTIGLGDGPNDSGFLNHVDTPVVIRSAKVEKMKKLVPRPSNGKGRTGRVELRRDGAAHLAAKCSRW